VERSSGRSYVSCSDLAMVADVALAFRTNFQLPNSNFPPIPNPCLAKAAKVREGRDAGARDLDAFPSYSFAPFARQWIEGAVEVGRSKLEGRS
jgi:hypothetical protein